jgi:hypothetical protein
MYTLRLPSPQGIEERLWARQTSHHGDREQGPCVHILPTFSADLKNLPESNVHRHGTG